MKITAFSITTSVAFVLVGTLILFSNVNADVCCRVPCDKLVDPSCQDTCQVGSGDHCYPLNSCPPQACQSQMGTLSPDNLKKRTSTAKVVVKKEGADA